MALLSDQQIRFLASQGIPLSQVFDASGMSRSEYQAKMRNLGMVVAAGVTPCAAAGHTLRTRAGHCVQCGTGNLAFIKRFDDPGLVYVAVSTVRQLTKVGTTSDTAARIKSLCSYGYGGAYDWRLHFHAQTSAAGRVEFKAHELLAKFRIYVSYLRSGMTVDCHELFTCAPRQAVAAVQSAIQCF